MKLYLYQNEFRLAWWKYGSQSDEPIHDVNSKVPSTVLSTSPPTSTILTEQFTATSQRTDRIPTQPVLKMLRTAQTEQTSVLDTISPVSKARPKDGQTVQRPLFKIGGITIKNNLNEFVRVSVQVRFIKRIHPF